MVVLVFHAFTWAKHLLHAIIVEKFNLRWNDEDLGFGIEMLASLLSRYITVRSEEKKTYFEFLPSSMRN